MLWTHPFHIPNGISISSVVLGAVCKTFRPVLRDRCPVCLSCPSSLSDLSVTLMYCGQTGGLIKMKLGTVVGLVPGHIVLDGDPAPPLSFSPRRETEWETVTGTSRLPTPFHSFPVMQQDQHISSLSRVFMWYTNARSLDSYCEIIIITVDLYSAFF